MAASKWSVTIRRCHWDGCLVQPEPRKWYCAEHRSTLEPGDRLHLCVDCGIEIWPPGHRCVRCKQRYVGSRLVSRPWNTGRRAVLLALYREGASDREIGASLGISHQAVHQLRQRMGLASVRGRGRPRQETQGRRRGLE